MKRLTLLCLSILLIHCGGTKVVKQAVQEHPMQNAPLTSEIPLDPKIETGTLNNGLKYFIRLNQKPEERAELRLVVNAGSILEDDDQQGLAHFTEHMAFNGTEKFKKHEIIDYLEGIGMKFGPEINAYTGFDETVYMLTVPTDSAEILEKAFEILSEWAHHVSFEDEEIDKERGVVIEEWRLGRGASARMRDKQFPVLFKGSKYANRLPIGKKEIIEQFEYATLKRFYKDWYRPDLMAIVAVGDFDKDTILSHIETSFGKLPHSMDARIRKNFPVPGHSETLYAIESDPEATGNSISVYFKKPLEEEKTVNDYKRMITESLYDRMLNERLYELTKKADPPYLYAQAGSGRFVRTKAVYFIGAQVKEGGIENGLAAILRESKRVRRFGFTPAELMRTKREMLRYMEKAVLEKDKTQSAAYAAEYTRHYLVDEPAPGIEVEYELYKRFLPNIQLSDIDALASKTIIDSNRVILVSMPEKEGLHVPTEAELAAVFDQVRSEEITPYEEVVSKEPLLKKKPKSGKIVSKKYYEKTDVTEWKLSNGVQVVLKPTDFKNDEVRFNATSPGGNSLVDNKDYVAAITTSTLARESGVGAFNKIELDKKLAGKIASVSPYISTLSEGLSGSASPEDMETMFQLIYLYFTQPRMDSTAFLSYQTRMKAYIQNRSVRPESAFGDTLRVTMSQYHPRSRPWQSELLDEMDMKFSMSFYKDRFKDAGDFRFFFVGNFDLKSIKPFILTYLGGLPTQGREENWKDLGILPPEGVVKKEVYKGMEPKSRFNIVFTGPFEYSRKNKYDFNAMLGVLNIKLREVIREDLGGTYGVRVSGSASKEPRERYSLTISMGCNPERVTELVDTIFTQLDSLAKFGVKDKYIQKVKENHLRSHETNLKENGYWMGALQHVYKVGRSPETILDVPEMVAALTAEDIRKAIQTYFRPDNYVQVVLYPEKQE